MKDIIQVQYKQLNATIIQIIGLEVKLPYDQLYRSVGWSVVFY